MSSDEEQQIEWDRLTVSIDFHDVGQFTRGGEIRVYRLRPVPDGAELWRVTETPGERTDSVKETLFRSSDEAAAFLHEMERALRAGGWSQA